MAQEGKERRPEDMGLSHRPPKDTQEGGDTGKRMVSSRERRRRMQIPKSVAEKAAGAKAAGRKTGDMKEIRLPEAQEPLREEPKLQAEAKAPEAEPKLRTERRVPEAEPKIWTESGASERKPAADTEGEKPLYRAPRRSAPAREPEIWTDEPAKREPQGKSREPELWDDEILRPAGNERSARRPQGAGRVPDRPSEEEGAGGQRAYSRRYEAEKRRHIEMAKKRRRRAKAQLAFGLILAVALVVLLCMIGWRAFHGSGAKEAGETPVSESSMPETGKLSEKDFAYSIADDKKEAGTPQEKREIGDYEGYAVRYPSLGSEAADEDLAARADDMISVFKSEASAKRSGKKDRMLLLADYESYQTGTDYVSVKFDIHKELAGTAEDSLETCTYRLSDGQTVALSDLLSEGYLELLSEKAASLASSQGGSMQAAAVAANEANFKYHTWSNEGLTLYFPAGTLTDSQTGVLSCTVPMDELTEYLTEDITGQGLPVGGGASSVDPTKPMVCLTFDDGPKASTTPELLDILEENDARATFFVVGDSLKKDGAEDIIRRELELGCQVGNHTLEHKNFKEISDEEITRQIEGVNDILKGWGFPACSTVRPPYGGWNNHVLAYITEYPLARWNVDTLDWQTKDVQSTINAVLYDEETKAADGDIILMHDIHAETIEACKTIIPELKARGFQLVTMEEMFEAKGIPYEGGQVYYSAHDIRTDFGS